MAGFKATRVTRSMPESLKETIRRNQADEGYGPIQGITPGSHEEWRIAQALTRLHIPFRYQVPLYGGRSVRGGMVLDFLIFNPFPIPLQVDGSFWHQKRKDADRMQDSILRNVYGRLPIHVPAEQIISLAAAIAWLKRERVA